MSDSASERPQTSYPASSLPASDPTEQTSSVVSPAPPVDPYDRALFVPNVFDFVSMARKAELTSRLPVMQLYLSAQSIDQSTYIGHGASFDVYSKAIPKNDGRELATPGLGTISAVRVPGHVARTLVYKTANIVFDESGEPISRHRRSMNSILMELHALMHPPLRDHKNIVTLLGLGWGSHYPDAKDRLPVLITEYADCGNLAELQHREILSPKLKHSIATDIASGLRMLHQCGIIHGDLKSENILMFSDTEKTFIAKLADFGFSVIGEAAAARIRIGGTFPWKAPEGSEPIFKEELPKTDVYSLGLTIWRLAMNGMNPFEILCQNSPSSAGFSDEVETLKLTNQVVNRVSLSVWYIKQMVSFQNTLEQDQAPNLQQTVQLLQQTMIVLKSPGADPSRVLALLEYTLWVLSRSSTMNQMPAVAILNQSLLEIVRKFPLMCGLEQILSYCLDLDPKQRDLEKVISSLRTSGNLSGEQTDKQSNEGFQVTVTSNQNLLRQSYDHHTLTWQGVRDLQPSVQSFIHRRLTLRTNTYASRHELNPPEHFLLAALYVNGYGTQPDIQEAIRLMTRAANNGHDVSRAYVWRLMRVQDPNLPFNESVLTMLEGSAYDGSQSALTDLSDIDTDRAQKVRRILKLGLAGVGASFWDKDLRHGKHPDWINTLRNTKVLIENFSTARDIKNYTVNNRGDHILHMASSCNQPAAVEAMLDSFAGLDINKQNDFGETPLLAACRSGHVEVVLMLLQRGADPKILTQAQESTLHWLISFEDEDIIRVGNALLEKGADLRVRTTRPVRWSVLRSGIDADNLYSGNALTWAVIRNRPVMIEFLLKSMEGPSACVEVVGDIPSAADWAAYYHRTECLKLMLDALAEARITFTYGQYLRGAIHSADLFSMILRNGVRWHQAMKETMDYLMGETHNVRFTNGIGGEGYTMLFFAISEGHDEIVKYLLNPETERMLAEGHEGARIELEKSGCLDRSWSTFCPAHTNRECGDEGRTPILECIRWNRHALFDLLINNGANIHSRSRNPFDATQLTWSALHLYAYAGHDTEFTLVDKILDAGLDVDGQLDGVDDLETPLFVAIKNNAFDLASHLLQKGANINALSSSSGLVSLSHPTTILGHVAGAAARSSVPRIKFLLSATATFKINVLVEPSRNLTVIHRAASAHVGVFDRAPDGSPATPSTRFEYDFAQNRDILYELLHDTYISDHVNARTTQESGSKTALHLAVDAVNLGAVQLLLDGGADADMQDSEGRTPIEIAIASSRHVNIFCDGVCKGALIGRRYKCTTCPDYDVCHSCFEPDKESHGHEFAEISLKETLKNIVRTRRSIKGVAELEELAEMVEVIDLLTRKTAQHRHENIVAGLDEELDHLALQSKPGSSIAKDSEPQESDPMTGIVHGAAG